MNKAELDQLKSIINELEETLNSSESGEENLYYLITSAEALYGYYNPKISEVKNLIIDYSRTLHRNSKVILDLLQPLYNTEENAFHSGIVPVTFEKLGICPEAQKVYKCGIDNYQNSEFQRNVLDDMRLSLEMLV